MKNLRYNAKPVIMEVFGEIVGYYNSTSDAAKHLNRYTTTITKRVEREAVIDCILLRYPRDNEDYQSYKCLSPMRLEKELPKKNPQKRGRPKKEGKVYNYDDELDDKYTLVDYEVKDLRICITKCTVRDFPQPLVGSAACARCPSFKGRNKKTHQVACSHILRRYSYDDRKH